MHIQNTSDIAFAEIHEAFLEAYSDYTVPMYLSLEQFREMTIERCYDPERSLVMMDGNTIAAFWLIGRNESIEAATLYCLCVGTRPDWRRKGLADDLFHEMCRRAEFAQLKQIVLEVLTENIRAFNAYRKMGFTTRRKVQISRGSFTSFKIPDNKMQVEEVTLTDARKIAATLGDWTPTWQNSAGSMEQSPDNALCLSVHDGDETVGLGCFVRSSGQIKQISTKQGQGKQNVSKADITALLLTTIGQGREDEPRSYINIDTSDTEILNTLTDHGWQHPYAQYEMVYPLTTKTSL